MDTLHYLGKALDRLSEALNDTSSTSEILVRDATIQRFEFCIELFWKTLKKCLDYEQVESTTPRDVFKKSFQNDLIDDEQTWIKIMNDRNVTSHTYHEELAQKIFQRIQEHFPVMKKTYDALVKKYENKMN